MSSSLPPSLPPSRQTHKGDRHGKTGFARRCPHLVVDPPEPHDRVMPVGDELGVIFGDPGREVLGTDSALEEVGNEALHRLHPAETPAQEHMKIRASVQQA